MLKFMLCIYIMIQFGRKYSLELVFLFSNFWCLLYHLMETNQSFILFFCLNLDLLLKYSKLSMSSNILNLPYTLKNFKKYIEYFLSCSQCIDECRIGLTTYFMTTIHLNSLLLALKSYFYTKYILM